MISIFKDVIKISTVSLIPNFENFSHNNFLLFSFALTICIASLNAIITEDFLYDFTLENAIFDWSERSDTLRELGKSKATLALQQTQKFQRAVIFGLLNPQPDLSGFAGVRFDDGPYDLANYTGFELKFRAQSYKVIQWEMILVGNKYVESYDYLKYYYQKFDVSSQFPQFYISD